MDGNNSESATQTTPAAQPNKINNKKLLKIIIQALFVLLVFTFLGRSLIYNWNRLEIDFDKINYSYLLLSLGCFIVAWVAAALCWENITKKFNKPLGLKKGTKLWVWSQSARYIPGSVWQVFGRVYLGEKHGLKKGETIASIAIETSNLIISSLVIFALTLPFWPKLPITQGFLPFIIAGLLIFAFLHPRVFNAVTRFFIIRLDKTNDSIRFKFKQIIWMILPYLLIWIIFGIGFYFIARAFGVAGIQFLPIATGSFALSWLIGFLFIIAPGGLGAREVALVYFLGLVFSNPVAVLLAILSRVLLIVAELLILLVTAFF